MPTIRSERLLYADGVTKPMIISWHLPKQNHIAKNGVAQRQSDIHFMQELNNLNVDGGSIPLTVPKFKFNIV